MYYKKTKLFLLNKRHDYCYVAGKFTNFIPNLIQQLTFKT